MTQPEQVCVQLPTSADTVALPAFAAVRRAASSCCCGAGRAAISRYILPSGPTAADLPPLPHAVQRAKHRRTNGQTDGQTPYRYVDPAVYTMPKTATDIPTFLDLPVQSTQ